jgi:hypothetical protein
MRQNLPDSVSDQDARAIGTLIEAQHMPPGPERSKALTKADRLRHAPEIYKHLFSSEDRPNEIRAD